MIPTYVFGFPTGQEQGDYLAVDLGALRSVRLFTITSHIHVFVRSDSYLHTILL
jgi:hexokinase